MEEFKKGKKIPWRYRKQVIARASGKCEACGTTVNLQIHHKKYRSRKRNDEDIHHPDNLALLCYRDHEKTHMGDSAMARFRTHSWQKIGETEEDYEQ